MQLKQSDYNFIYSDLGKDTTVMYNSRTGALAVLKEEQNRQLDEFLTSGRAIEDEDFLDKLLQCGYLLPAEVDEPFLIRQTLMHSRYNTRVFSLTIAPTMACNFRCIYCFEKGRYGKGQMDDETVGNVIEFIKGRLRGIDTLHISWYGGEPLLAMSVIETISKAVIPLCEANDVLYDASIITNGYLYTKQVAERLKEYQVKRVQITLDGPKETHDARRPLVNGGSTYDVILNNLIAAKGILPVSIRVNVDVDSIDMVNDIVQFLREQQLLESCYPYLAPVIPYNKAYEEERCLSSERYSCYNLQFLLDNQIPLQSIYPKPRGNYCIADSSSGWVIDDRGDIYKCWNEIADTNKSVGNVNRGRDYLQHTYVLEQFLGFDPTLDEECESCNLLPVCVGGCPHSRITGLDRCEQRRHNLQEYIVQCAKAILREKRRS